MDKNRSSLKWEKRFFSFTEQKRNRRTGAILLRDILMAAERGAKKTHIMFESNMNPLVLSRYLEFSLQHGLLIQRANIYFTTEKGKEFLACFRRLEELMENINRTEQELARLLE